MMLIGGSVMFLILVVLIILGDISYFSISYCFHSYILYPYRSSGSGTGRRAPWRLSGNIWCRYPFYGAIY